MEKVILKHCQTTGRVQLTMSKEVATLLMYLTGGLGLDHLTGNTAIKTSSIVDHAKEIRKMVSEVYFPLYNHFGETL